MDWIMELFGYLGDAIDTTDGDGINLSDANSVIDQATQAAIGVADQDGSGDISTSDIMAGVSNMSEKVIELIDQDHSGSINSNDLTQAVFSLIDKNRNGQLEPKDFEQLLMGFVDKNGDGQLTSIDTAIRRAAVEIGENYGPLAKKAFGIAAKNIL